MPIHFGHFRKVQKNSEKKVKTTDSSIICALPLSCVQVFVTLLMAACQTPLSMRFFKQEYRSGLPFSSSRDSFQPRDRTQASCIAGRFFTVWRSPQQYFCVGTIHTLKEFIEHLSVAFSEKWEEKWGQGQRGKWVQYQNHWVWWSMLHTAQL